MKWNVLSLLHIITSVTFLTKAQLDGRRYLTEGFGQVESFEQAVQRINSLNIKSKQESLQQILTNSLDHKGIDLDTMAAFLGRLSQLKALDVNVSETCFNRTEHYLGGLMTRQIWALRMFDATTKLPSGILDGKMIWTGSFDECTKVKATVQIKVNGTDNTTHLVPTDQFDGQYCMPTVPAPKSMAAYGVSGIYVGICVPAGCSEEDVKGLVNTFLAVLGVKEGGVSNVNCAQVDKTWTSDAIAVVCVTGAFVLLVAIATIYDVVIQHKESPEPTVISVPYGGQNITANGSVGDHSLRVDDYTQLVNNTANPYVKKVNQAGTLSKVILAFSVYTNGAKVLNTKQGSGALTCVNGIRFLSLSWVIWGHSYAFCFTFVGNIGPIFEEYKNSWTMQPLWSGTFSVDTFFVMSGLLVTYLTLREMKKGSGRFRVNWGLYYFHRFWRLTPPYMLVMMVYVPTFYLWGNGPGWPKGGIDPNCKNYWWANILYINNLLDMSKMCMGWSWYLANDMQFFVISPLILFPLFWKELIGLVILLILLLGSFIATGVLANVNHLEPSSQYSQQSQEYMEILYMKPWTRIGPYLVGMVAGYILYVTECKPKLNWVTALLGWAVATAAGLAVVYGLHDVYQGHPLSNDVSALYITVSRTVWGACVAWVIYACCTGYGGFVNTLMSWGAFVPLGRLTYCAYLVHPVIMYFVYMSRRTLIYATDVSMTYFFFGHLVAAYGCAFVVSMMFEAPMMGLEKAILNRDKSA
ncbi:nose resistant to fluoxetine protein 6 [Lingula anatina]|uniref:Nose resistant to fluoxetine protein 6 n=1 Tax=Lingula anatina TaxID=7574 RepID=A0A1S3JQG4_LINAN|nr:nose resistant to fluoxetine protein 6 [Lingula anatina]|eukprot:XP_013412597.1 nose resistant to fluoxetine protein 6 [Lingula anatina]